MYCRSPLSQVSVVCLSQPESFGNFSQVVWGKTVVRADTYILSNVSRIAEGISVRQDSQRKNMNRRVEVPCLPSK